MHNLSEVSAQAETETAETYVPQVTKDNVQEFLSAPITGADGEEFLSTFGVAPLKRTRPFDPAPWETMDEIALYPEKRDKLFAFVRYSIRTGVGHAIPTAPDRNGDRKPALFNQAQGEYLKVALKAILTVCNATESFSVSVVPVGSHRDSKVNVVLRPIVTKQAAAPKVPLKVFAESTCNSITF